MAAPETTWLVGKFFTCTGTAWPAPLVTKTSFAERRDSNSAAAWPSGVVEKTKPDRTTPTVASR